VQGSLNSNYPFQETLYEAKKIKMARFSKTFKLKNSKLYLLEKII
jgi:hypothetical protein